VCQRIASSTSLRASPSRARSVAAAGPCSSSTGAPGRPPPSTRAAEPRGRRGARRAAPHRRTSRAPRRPGRPGARPRTRAAPSRAAIWARRFGPDARPRGSGSAAGSTATRRSVVARVAHRPPAPPGRAGARAPDSPPLELRAAPDPPSRPRASTAQSRTRHRSRSPPRARHRDRSACPRRCARPRPPTSWRAAGTHTGPLVPTHEPVADRERRVPTARGDR
jgi:hypothetical protein